MGVTEVDDEVEAERVEELEADGRVTIGGGLMSASPFRVVAVEDLLRLEDIRSDDSSSTRLEDPDG